ncbi:MAG: EamA family transporter [Candidatus Korobacteraceae bacterium]
MEAHVREKQLRLKTRMMILIMVLAGPLGNALLAKGMKQIGAISVSSLSDLLHLLGQILSSPTIWMGIAGQLAFFAAYSLALSWADYSYVQPASSVAYVVVAILGIVMLHESVSPLRWLGIGVICLGVVVVGRTHPNTTETP